MKNRSVRRAAWLTAAALPLMLTFHDAAAAACEAQVRQSLQELSVPQSDVESVEIQRRSRAPNPPTNYVYDAWVRLGSCGQGYLVVNMTRYCHVLQSYTRDDCQVSGLPQY